MVSTITHHNRAHNTGAQDHSLVPSGGDLRQAFADGPAASGGHPLLNLAAALVAEHRLGLGALTMLREEHSDDHIEPAAVRAVNAAEAARAVLVERIDTWVLAEQPWMHRGVSVHTESLGQVVDRLAQEWTRWTLLEDTADAVPRHERHEALARAALQRVAELVGAYDDLIRDLRGHHRLPRHQGLAGPSL